MSRRFVSFSRSLELKRQHIIQTEEKVCREVIGSLEQDPDSVTELILDKPLFNWIRFIRLATPSELKVFFNCVSVSGLLKCLSLREQRIKPGDRDAIAIGIALDCYKDHFEYPQILGTITNFLYSAEIVTTFISRGYDDSKNGNIALAKAIANQQRGAIKVLLNVTDVPRVFLDEVINLLIDSGGLFQKVANTISECGELKKKLLLSKAVSLTSLFSRTNKITPSSFDTDAHGIALGVYQLIDDFMRGSALTTAK